jgi:hypothetical protein
MNPDGRRRRISDITLERYLLGELPDREMAETKRVLEEDEESRARFRALKRSNREILDQYPPDFMGRQIQSRLDRQDEQSSKKGFFTPWPMAAFMGAAAATLLLLAFLPPELITSRPVENVSTEQIKGHGPNLKLYRKTPDGSEALKDGARAHPGDVIRIGYQAAGHPYGVIVSVDGRGAATLHLPDGGNRSARLQNQGQVLLDFALELDNAPGWERYYFVTSDAPFEVAPVVRAAEQIDIERPVDRPEKLNLSKDLDQFVVSLKKGT